MKHLWEIFLDTLLSNEYGRLCIPGPKGSREDIVIATKLAAYPWRLTAGQFVKACQYASLILLLQGLITWICTLLLWCFNALMKAISYFMCLSISIKINCSGEDITVHPFSSCPHANNVLISLQIQCLSRSK